MPLAADADAKMTRSVDRPSTLEPLAACPHSPDNVKPVRSLSMTKVDQGVHRQLHQLQLCGSDDRGRDPEGQNRYLPK